MSQAVKEALEILKDAKKKKKPRYTGNPPGSAERCTVCGLRVRGTNHEAGGHHKGLDGYRRIVRKP